MKKGSIIISKDIQKMYIKYLLMQNDFYKWQKFIQVTIARQPPSLMWMRTPLVPIRMTIVQMIDRMIHLTSF